MKLNPGAGPFMSDQAERTRDLVYEKVRDHGLNPDHIKDGVVLGSGLGGFGKDQMNYKGSASPQPSEPVAIPFALLLSALGNDLLSSVNMVPGHANQLLIGPLKGTDESRLVIAQSGREHPYQGVDTRRATFWLRVMQMMGVETLVSSNAAGIVTPDTLTTPQLMLIHSSQDLAGDEGPLHGVNDPRFGPLFPHRNDVFPSVSRGEVLAVARELGIHLDQGMYVRMKGPEYEDPETVYRLREMIEGIWRQGKSQPGEDRFQGAPVGVVGMSTTYEAAVANHAAQSKLVPAFQRRAFISAITNYAASLGPHGILPPPEHDHVTEMSQQVEAIFIPLVRALLLKWREGVSV